VLIIVITPLENSAGFLIISTLYTYIHTYIGGTFPFFKMRLALC
jgi:hypothetical protein